MRLEKIQKPFPILSIIIPTKNGEQFISDALQSVIDQNYPNLEVIVVDGASTDKTVDIVKGFIERYPFITLVSEADSGQSQAMNKGLKLASGEIVGFLNDDDYYSKNIFEEVMKLFSLSTQPSLFIGNCYSYNLESKTVSLQKPSLIGIEYPLLGVQFHPVNSSQYFYHKSVHDIIGCFPEDEHFSMDLWFYLECCISKKIKTKYVDHNWGNFRLYPGTKTFDNRDLTGIMKRARRKYCSKFRIVPTLHAVLLRIVKKFS
jgi:glycosyltransferase involved in cell wall biosynthesis